MTAQVEAKPTARDQFYDLEEATVRVRFGMMFEDPDMFDAVNIARTPDDVRRFSQVLGEADHPSVVRVVNFILHLRHRGIDWRSFYGNAAATLYDVVDNNSHLAEASRDLLEDLTGVLAYLMAERDSAEPRPLRDVIDQEILLDYENPFEGQYLPVCFTLDSNPGAPHRTLYVLRLNFAGVQ